MIKLDNINKKLIKIIFLVLIILFFVLIKQVHANSIENIDMDVYIDKNGNATVTEIWKAILTKGTEGYRTFSSLGDSKISNFSVSDDSGKVYESISKWNTNASFTSKAYKSGIYNSSNGLELCWGISSYGYRTYTLKYNISNLVTQYTDTQGIYFNFLKLGQAVENATITIHSDYPLSLDNAKIWSLGNKGNINFENNKIVLKSEGNLSSNEYMVALIRFEKNLFNISNKSALSFDNTYYSAMSDVKENSTNNIDMDVYIDKNGNATVTETWNAYFVKEICNYRTFEKNGNSKISNFSVSDETGKTYKTLSKEEYTNLLFSKSFNGWAYRSYLSEYTDGETSLSWGISNYGEKTYTLKYNISNLVTEYTDAQGIYFNFLDLGSSVGNATITIHSYYSFSLDNAEIYTFGNEGNINFENGNIVLKSDGELKTSKSMIALVKFKSNLFSTSNKLEKSFKRVYKSLKEEYEPSSVDWNMVFIFTTIFIGGVIISTRKALRANKEYREKKFDFGPGGKKIPDMNQINYYREIPCNKDLQRAYWICYQYDLVPERTLQQGIIGAILLKWIKNGYIAVRETKKGLFNIKDNDYAIDLTKMMYADNAMENELLYMLVKASGNRILEPKELEKWSRKNFKSINKWFNNIKDKESKKLEQQGLIVEQKYGLNRVSEQLREEAIQLRGLKKFLLDFSMMPEREYYEVHIWEEYLIFAQLLGIADKVAEQFSKLYPKFNIETKLNTDITTIAIISMAENCYKNVKTATEEYDRRNLKINSSTTSSYDYSGSSRDTGGGGDSYHSGGSSAGGSSGGGFR